MKILDTSSGRIHEYGESGHDSLHVSEDGKYLTYYNLQTGDGSKYGGYLFVCDDDKIPAESSTEEAKYSDVYFNIGGWHERLKGEWTRDDEHSITIDMFKCSVCNGGGHRHFRFCPHCGAEMRGNDNE